MTSHIASLYEELRKAIDEGSESMTHDDALKQIAYWWDKCSQVQAVEPVTGERAELIELPVAFGEIQYQRPSGQWGRIEGYTRNQMREAVAAAVAKAEAKHAQQVAVPMTEDQIEAACRFIEPSLDGPIAYDLLIARAIEAHHGIGSKLVTKPDSRPEPTDWSAA